MKIEYHKRGWRCPGCGKWIAVNRRKVGAHIRTCSICKTKAVVTTQVVSKQTWVTEKEIIIQPVRVG